VPALYRSLRIPALLQRQDHASCLPCGLTIELPIGSILWTMTPQTSRLCEQNTRVNFARGVKLTVCPRTLRTIRCELNSSPDRRSVPFSERLPRKRDDDSTPANLPAICVSHLCGLTGARMSGERFGNGQAPSRHRCWEHPTSRSPDPHSRSMATCGRGSGRRLRRANGCRHREPT
jgi:hypothetical protein